MAPEEGKEGERQEATRHSLFGTAMSSELPIELIALILSYLSDYKDLNHCSFVSKDFRRPSQHCLFSNIRLARAPIYTIRLCSLLEKSMHIRNWIHDLTLQAGFTTPQLELLLSILPNIHALTLRNDNYQPALIRVLEKHTFAGVTRLLIEDATITLSIFDECPNLVTLILQNGSEFYRNGQFSSLQVPLRLLSIDCWQQGPSGRVNGLLPYFTKGCFPSLRCILLPCFKGRSECPVKHVTQILDPCVTKNLTCLDLDIWDVVPQTSNSNFGTIPLKRLNPTSARDFYFLNNYPRLRCFRLGFNKSEDLPGMPTTRRVTWIARIFESLTQVHPLETLIFAPSNEFTTPVPVDQPPPVQKPFQETTDWDKVDVALQSGTLPHLREVIIQLPNAEDKKRFLFQNALIQTNTAGQLKFQGFNFEEQFYRLYR